MMHTNKLIATALLLMLATASPCASFAAAKKKARKAPAATEKVSADKLLADIEAAFDAYDFAGAAADLEKYRGLKDASEAEAERLDSRIAMGASMLERVQKIVVVDSLTVDKATFFKAYNLNPAAGSLSTPAILPEGFAADSATAVYSTESGDRRLWAAPDPARPGATQIVSSSLLADGTWEQPAPLDPSVNSGHNANYPFIMADGITLYFADRDPGTSLGGYDIYAARFDGEKYLEPQNIGMPFNSTSDDYLLAIDETTGAGWWATDRNHLDGKLTVYVYIPSELRINYPADTPGLASLGRLTDYRATQAAGADYSALLDRISKPMAADHTHTAADEFEFALPDGSVIRSLDQLDGNPAVRRALEAWLDRRDDLSLLLDDLSRLRADYAAGNRTLAPQILAAETEELRIRADIRRLAAAAVNAATR